jgi:hypothetical protein
MLAAVALTVTGVGSIAILTVVTGTAVVGPFATTTAVTGVTGTDITVIARILGAKTDAGTADILVGTGILVIAWRSAMDMVTGAVTVTGIVGTFVVVVA